MNENYQDWNIFVLLQVLFRYALGILSYMEEKLMKQGDYMSIFNTFRTEVYIYTLSSEKIYDFFPSPFPFHTSFTFPVLFPFPFLLPFSFPLYPSTKVSLPSTFFLPLPVTFLPSLNLFPSLRVLLVKLIFLWTTMKYR